MSASSSSDPRSPSFRKRLPINPSLENLRKQAKRLSRTRPSLSLQQSQHQLALEYGCRQWAELVHVVETMSRGAKELSGGKREWEPLPAAANASDLVGVRRILADGPFTQHDLDLALARAVLRFRERREIAELLVAHGADPDGQYGAAYGPIIFVTGECLDPEGLEFLVNQGADVAFPPVASKYGDATPLSHVMGTYVRGQNERKHRCIDVLLDHGAVVPSNVSPPMLAIHRGDAAALGDILEREASLLDQRFPEMPFGNIALAGATLTHMAIEFGELECVDVLLDHGADLNAPALMIDGLGGQTPIFHAIAANQDAGVTTLQHLAARLRRIPDHAHVDVTIRATFRRYGQPITPALTPLEYAERFNANDDSSGPNPREIELLRSLTEGGQ